MHASTRRRSLLWYAAGVAVLAAVAGIALYSLKPRSEPEPRPIEETVARQDAPQAAAEDRWLALEAQRDSLESQAAR